MDSELGPLPKKIRPCPIIEAIAELKFASAVLQDAIFGIIYQAFKDDFPGKVERLPILQLPEPLRSTDPNLKYQPYYRLIAGDLLFQIGPNVASINNVKNYLGWDIFSKKITETFSKLENLKIIKAIDRLAIRYINLFKLDIFDNINLGIVINGEPLKALQTTLRTEIQRDDFINILQIANNANANIQNQVINGSVIDIETVYKDSPNTLFKEMDNILGKAHLIEKRLFFSLLKEEFLKTLNPEY